MTARAPVALAVLIGLVLWLAVRGHDGYDLDYALFWGGQLAHGHVPDFATPFAPTPHPLANLLGALVTPLGAPAAGDAFRLVVELSLGAMALAGYRLGARLAGPAAGWLAAIVLLSRPALVASALRGAIDIPALALTLFALDALLDRRWNRALILLGFAGLLRPEAWLLSLAVVAWRRDVRSLPLALAAPVIWCAGDLAITGDPLYSLHGTRALAENLDRPRSAPLAPLLVPRLITDVVGLPVLLAGAIGLFAAADRPTRELRTVLAVVAVALATFVVIGAAGLPLLARYLLPPAALLAILGAGSAVGGPLPLQLAAVACLMISLVGTISGLSGAIADARMRRAVQADLRVMVRRPGFVHACRPVSAVTYREVPEIASAAGVAPATIRPVPTGATILLPRSADAVTTLQSAADPSPLLLRPPAGYALGAQTRHWAIAQRCVRP